MNPMRNRLLRVGLVLAFLIGAGWWIDDNHIWIKEYNRNPPSVVFAEVIGKPVPAGVTQLKVAARQLFIKRWVKMRFEATPGALQVLTKDKEPIASEWRSHALASGQGVANDRFESMDLKTVGWQGVARIKKPEIYQFSSYTSENFNWVGYFIIDRPRGIVFIHAGGG